MGVDFKVEGIENIILKKVDAIAEKYSKKCIACGGCNFFCPSCSCFNVADVADGKVIRREQSWDSCLYRGFTWLAGGVFERASIDSTKNRRVLHKLLYTKSTSMRIPALDAVGVLNLSIIHTWKIYSRSLGSWQRNASKSYIPKLATISGIKDENSEINLHN
jgi:ferredoxin